ncbi:small ribosomal subunit protein mS23 [Salminus brasiliensis]|uniref:small ribosomal subunit protein mS23 n=1 Tax=Salminus brasiliensis TaxID=930266 RepID=UPI003B82D56B
MAGSRLEKFGTVYTRVRDLMRSGVIKESEKPLWFDVYTAFPPKREPLYVKSSKRIWPQKREDPVPEIFYKEDLIRVKFFETYGNDAKPLNLAKSNYVSTCQRFVNKYSELESRGDVKPEYLINETWKALLDEGLLIRRRGYLPVAPKQPDPVLSEQTDPLLSEAILAEPQKDTTQAPEEQRQAVTTDGSTAL